MSVLKVGPKSVFSNSCSSGLGLPLADAPGCRTGAHRQSDVVPAGRGREVAIRRVRIHGGSGHSSSATVHNLLRCDVCHNQYSDWVCCHDEWRGLPASLHDSCLCRACFEGLRRSPFAWAYFLTVSYTHLTLPTILLV